MNILIVSEGIPGIPESNRLTGIFAFDQAKALAEKGHHVVFVCLDTYSLREVRKLGTYWTEKNDIPVLVISIPIGRYPLGLCARIAGSLLDTALNNEKQNIGPVDIIHAHFCFEGYAAVNIRAYDCPVLITEHSSRLNKESISKDLFRLGQEAFSKADICIAVGNVQKKRLEAHFKRKFELVPNLTQTELFNLKKKKHSGFRFICVGNLVDIKRMDLLIKLFSEAFSSEQDVSLIIVGEGPLFGRLQNQINKSKCKDRIVLKGGMKREQLAVEYSNSDCFILLSLRETFGVAYTEAMAAGLPVIATRCGGPEDFVNETSGIILDVNDEIGVVNAMEYMVKRSNDYNGKEIRETIVSKYSPNVIAAMLSKLYMESIYMKDGVQTKKNDKE